MNLHCIFVLVRHPQLGFLSSPACMQGSKRKKRAAGQVVFVLRYLKGGGLVLLIIVMYTFTVTFSPQYIVLLSSFYQLTLKHKAIIKGGWSANKFRKYANVQTLKIVRFFKTSPNIGHLQAQSFLETCRYVVYEFAICGPKLFCRLKTSTWRQTITFLLTDITNTTTGTLSKIGTKIVLKKTTFRTTLRQSCAVFCINVLIYDLWICHENLRICHLQPGTPKKFSDLRQWNEPKIVQICDFADCAKNLLPHLWP